MMHDPVLAVGRATALLALTLVALIIALPLWPLYGHAPRWLVRAWQVGCCRIAGLQLRVRGAPSTARPTLWVANHVSYFDIVVLSSLLDAAFIAKAEMAKWPVIGLIARLGRTLFVQRIRSASAGQCKALAARLEAGDGMILFGEGTSSAGSRVLPFKSTLLAALGLPHVDRPVTVQPVSLAYTRFRGGLTMVHSLRPLYGWYGDMALLPHLWFVLGLPGVEVEVRFHPQVAAAAFHCRKALARHLESEVARGVAAARAA
jgi:1-acyl-sn-glycerol-3-phosphate acyltransferase